MSGTDQTTPHDPEGRTPACALRQTDRNQNTTSKIVPNHTSDMNPAGTGGTGTVLCRPSLSVHYFAFFLQIHTNCDFFR